MHGALRRAGLYLRDELAELARPHPHFSYTPVVLDAEGNSDIEAGTLDGVVGSRFGSLATWRGFVCGDPAIVRSLKRKLFLAGMPMRDIYSDAFLPSA